MAESTPWLIVGLGNPGKVYELTRHNVGFMCVDRLAQQLGLTFKTMSKCQADVAKGTIQGVTVILAKPTTYMNLSGQAWQKLCHWFSLEAAQSLIIYDDVDIPMGSLRLRTKGSAGTHNGMKSILAMGMSPTTELPRLRFGVGPYEGPMDLADFVLSRFPAEQESLLDTTIDKAVAAIEEVCKKGLEAAMNQYNGTPLNESSEL